MVRRIFKSIVFYSMIFVGIQSCGTYQKDILLTKEIDKLPQLNIYDISWGDCMRYENPYVNNDSIIAIGFIGKEAYKYRSKFLAKIYVKENCEYQITYQGEVLNGTYRINGINFPIEGKSIIGTFRPEYVVANFENGKREGGWEYYGSDFESIPWSKEKLTPIKIEIYKDGLPDGEWWQKSANKTEYFIYKRGKLVNQKTIYTKD